VKQEGFMSGQFKITVVYDNHSPVLAGLKSSWGFACVVEGFGQTILFDTGTSGPILLNNLFLLQFHIFQLNFHLIILLIFVLLSD